MKEMKERMKVIYLYIVMVLERGISVMAALFTVISTINYVLDGIDAVKFFIILGLAGLSLFAWKSADFDEQKLFKTLCQYEQSEKERLEASE